MLRTLSIVCAVGALSLGAWAAYVAYQDSGAAAPDPPFIVEPIELDLGAVPLGERTIEFAITNPARKSRRIIGLAEGCSPGLCFSSNHHTQIVVQPGDTFRYGCKLTTKRPGRFEAEIDVHLEDNGVRTVALTVRGEAVATGGAPNSPNP